MAEGENWVHGSGKLRPATTCRYKLGAHSGAHLNLTCPSKDLPVAREWYIEKRGFRKADTDREEDSGRPFTDLCISNDDTFLSLVELEPGTSPERGHVVFYAKNLEEAHRWLSGRGVVVQPFTSDSGGNRFFSFHDVEGNAIEVCVEP